MRIPAFPARHVHNAFADAARPYGERERRVIGLGAYADARAAIEVWPGYGPTPLVALDGLAAGLGFREVLYKDEGFRFGLKSFKALGGAYAVLGVLTEEARRRGWEGLDAAALLAGGDQAPFRDVTVAAATDGNHGRSVAWGAQMFGCRCVIYLHEHVSRAREAAIALFGAEIVRVPGHYDASVRRCAEDAAANGWSLVADTSSDAEAAVPAMVMQGYTLIAEEILEARGRGAAMPSHVFVQAGVGGLAAALAGHFWERLGSRRPRLVVVEPNRADCVFRTVSAGRPTPVDGDADTFMACLAAGEISAPAWIVLEHGADDVIALDDEAAAVTMRLLAEGVDGDRPIAAGESGCAATAGLIAASGDATLRAALALSPDSVVVVIGSEGATDEETFQRVVGRTSEDVLAAGAAGSNEEADA